MYFLNNIIIYVYRLNGNLETFRSKLTIGSISISCQIFANSVWAVNQYRRQIFRQCRVRGTYIGITYVDPQSVLKRNLITWLNNALTCEIIQPFCLRLGKAEAAALRLKMHIHMHPLDSTLARRSRSLAALFLRSQVAAVL